MPGCGGYLPADRRWMRPLATRPRIRDENRSPTRSVTSIRRSTTSPTASRCGHSVNALPQCEREVLQMRFFESMTQSQIAQRIGCSQMQMSRILARTLQRLRDQLE